MRLNDGFEHIGNWTIVIDLLLIDKMNVNDNVESSGMVVRSGISKGGAHVDMNRKKGKHNQENKVEMWALGVYRAHQGYMLQNTWIAWLVRRT